MTPWIGILLCVFFLVCGGYFDGAETGIYRVSRFRIRLGLRGRRPLYALLMNLLNDGQGVVLSTLIGTNLFCYLATYLMIYLLLDGGMTHSAAEGITTLLMTPITFIYVEIIPKSVFYHRADTIMPWLAGPLWFFHLILTRCGIIAVLKILLRGLNRLFGSLSDTPTALSRTGRHEARQIIRETHEEGYLTPTQQDLLDSLLDAQDIRIESVLIPLAKTHSLPLHSSRSTVLDFLRTTPVEHAAIYRHNIESIIGWIPPALVAADSHDFEDLTPWVNPILWIPTDMRVLDAVDRMADDHQFIAAVWDPRNAKGNEPTAIGLITLGDLFQTLTEDRPGAG